ncbi:MAG: type I-E CRISPR-associated endoribonuclease Cas2e [Fimbriimonadales bacterium]|nr:type I-E CRISPR-associated endoribonuclease Cas2e [Fimbriimonadales bacterium]
MTVLILTAVKPGLRGELTRWLLEPKAGVFVGRLGARVRDKLWARIERDLRDGDAVLICSAQNDQGFEIRCLGDPTRVPIDFEGLTLILRKKA